MTTSQINSEIKNTKEILSKLKKCIKEGKKEYMQDYTNASAYLLRLNQVKPNHSLLIS